MRSSLERSQTSHATNEIAAEFPQHWFGQPVFVDLKNTNSKRVSLYQIDRRHESGLYLLADTERLIPLLTSTKPIGKQTVSIIRSKKPLTFPPGHTRPETFAGFLAWLDALDPVLASRALAATQAMFPDQSPVFVAAPNATVGIRLEFLPAIWRSFQRPQAFERYVDHRRGEVKIIRFTGGVIDPAFIYTRNMSTQPNLSGKRITLVGCGTIGSHLAKMLAQSGAGYGAGARLTLIDQQSLTAGNIGRHLLGLPDIGRSKAEAVADMLSQFYPELEIAPIQEDVLRRLGHLNDDDLVIDATGDEGVSNAINAHLIQTRRKYEETPAAIFSWLFGNGAAAQALCVTSLNDACYRCLRPAHGGQWRFSPLKSEYAAIEVPAACGEGPFFPYGVAAPATAAALALQLALDWVKGNPSPRLRTQRLLSEGTQQVRDQDPRKSAHCPACGTDH